MLGEEGDAYEDYAEVASGVRNKEGRCAENLKELVKECLRKQRDDEEQASEDNREEMKELTCRILVPAPSALG